MSPITKIKTALVGGWLKRVLTKENLLQRSTWAGLLKLVVPVIGVQLTDHAHAQAVDFFLYAVSAYFAAKGAWDVARDERKALPWAAK